MYLWISQIGVLLFVTTFAGMDIYYFTYIQTRKPRLMDSEKT